MMLKAWLRRVGASNLRRLLRGRQSIQGKRAELSPASAANPVRPEDPMFSVLAPDAVTWTSVHGVGPVDTVRSFLFGVLPSMSVAPSATHPEASGGPSSGYSGGRPAGDQPPDQLLSRLWKVLASPSQLYLPGPDSAIDWPGELMAFQLDGVKALVGSQRLLLADDMGLGKTIQVIVALRILFLRGEIETAMVIAPASVLDQWRRELLKWAPDLRAMVIRGSASDRGWQWATPVHVALVSYETLRADFGESAHSPVSGKTWGVVVADEAQRIKNRNITSQAVKGLKRERSWALTGTPLENSEEELASIMEFVDSGGPGSPKRYTAGLALRQRHQELQLRRKKADVLEDLPPKTITKLSVELGPAQRRSYDRAEKEGIVHLKALGRDVRVRHVLELISRLKQICNADLETGESSKFAEIHRRLEALVAEENRAIVFSQYTRAGFGVEAVADALQKFRPLIFTGAQAPEERREIMEQFRRNDQHKVLVLSLRAGGVGLNIQEASYVFHLDRWWNPAVERQAEDRSHRFGQTVPVHVFKYACTDTIEERIDRILEQKQELFDDLVDDISMDLSKVFTARELFGLFGLEAPAGMGGEKAEQR